METINADNLNQLKGAIPLHEYERLIVETDRFSIEDINPILLGLYGEVGSIMATSKKYRREKKAYLTYKDAVEEEFGDALWYFCALCRRVNAELAGVFIAASNETGIKIVSANDQENAPISQIVASAQVESLDSSLIELGSMAAQLLKTKKDSANVRDELVQFARLYLQAMQSTGLSFAKVVKGNLIKTLGRFTIPDKDSLPDFDAEFPEEEQLPRHFEIHITQRKSGQCYLRWNDVFIGSPLTDNIRDSDGYRFHDVFHLAHAAILHWSPTFRALIKQKRKSDPFFDEAQDGGRAIVVEEGLTAWLYSYSKGLDYFEGHDSVSFDALKTIEKFVHGYEVDKCPLKLWEDAILQGYSVFRQVRMNNGGIVIGDRENRTISYRPIGE
ncbi:MAG: nucleoside triphosphate pyrophosphohydrolase family protein [Candidatus Thiodiazotropha lotti]|nr:nucleoside triphosphate pyrophosphohydrolase family protein [Candidatus Thiodiazotropha lotti]MCW4221645.1 nucleoside triphosphate pyrophosphohydrolase family protein [Candidatus Thiodiazotropha lotti]